MIPAGVIGIGVVRKSAWQEGAALVEWQGPYHSCGVNSQDLAHASLADLMPSRLRQLGRWTLGRVGKGVGLVATVVITVVVTLEVQHFLGKCGP